MQETFCSRKRLCRKHLVAERLCGETFCGETFCGETFCGKTFCGETFCKCSVSFTAPSPNGRYSLLSYLKLNPIKINSIKNLLFLSSFQFATLLFCTESVQV